mmetsp:Transcript_7590/g.11020  ORF Transcript_7590/g.11020 Transcript_7590/m.11020 type:complete len:767 (-) Transcript_7590:7919-10219(-)
MSGNGGHPSSLQAATSGSPPYDPGPRASPKQQESTRRYSPSQAEAYNFQTGGLLSPPGRNNQQDFQILEDIMQGYDEATALAEDQDSQPSSFVTGVRELFPMGINQPRTSLRTDPTPRVTPRTASAKRPDNRSLSILQEEEEVQFIETRNRSGGILQGNDFQRASDKVLKILPEKEEPALSSTRSYNFIAELQFNTPLSNKGLKLEGSKEFNVPNCLSQWIKKTREAAPDFILHPYRPENGGNPITSEKQIPSEDSDAINMYYHNHRVENNGILRGMVRFSITVPWMNLKDMRSPYFKWLTNNRIYLRHTSFDADTVVLLGFLLDQHPDAARLLDLTKELKERLNLPEGIDMQLTPRNLSTIDSEITKTRFNFRAIAVETDGKMAGAVKEAFFRLGDPKVAQHSWPISGKSLFVPMFKTAAWTTETISAIAKVHSKKMSQLDQIFVENIYDLDKKIIFKDVSGKETPRTIREAIQSSTTLEGDERAVHSVHGTNRPGVIRILVTAVNAIHAKNFFGNLQEHLKAAISPEDLHNLTQGKNIQITDRVHESTDSKTYAGYAAAILRENPQDGVVVPELSSPQRKKSRREISYSRAAKRAINNTTSTANTDENPEDEETNVDLEEGWEATANWEQKIQDTFTSLFGDRQPLKAEDVEQKIQEAINRQAEESEKRLARKFAKMEEFTLRENEKSKRMIQRMFEKQNQLLLNLTEQMQISLSKLDENIKDVAMQTDAEITHTEIPRIEVRNTSPVAQRQDIGSAGLSDAMT